MLPSLAPAQTPRLPVMPEIVPVVPAAIAPAPAPVPPADVPVRPFTQHRGIPPRSLPLLELHFRNSGADLAQALGYARYRCVISSIYGRRFRLHSGQQRGNPQNTGGEQHSKCLFHSATHGHWQAPALLGEKLSLRVFLVNFFFECNASQVSQW